MSIDSVLDKTKLLISEQVSERRIFNKGIPFDSVQKVYYSTNENISGYMSLFDLNKDVLTVMGSGDHPFNAIVYGATSVDTFDTNLLTKFYALGIKRSAIMAFNYYEYLDFFKKIINNNISLEELNSLINQLYPYMDKNDRIFWKSILNYNNYIQKNSINPINLFRMLLINITPLNEDIKKNSYLFNENYYNILKSRISKYNFNFYNIECLDLPFKLNKRYDLIFLSNIADYFYQKFDYYWKYNNLSKVTNDFNRILNENGILFINYLYNFYSCISKKYRNTLASASSLKLCDLINENYYTFNNIKSNNIKDGILIKIK